MIEELLKEHEEEAKQALKDNKWKEFKEVIKSKVDNFANEKGVKIPKKTLVNRELRNFKIKLEDMIHQASFKGIEESEYESEMERIESEKELKKLFIRIKKNFHYNRKNLKFQQLEEKGFSVDNLSAIVEPPPDIMSNLENLLTLAEDIKDEIFVNNVKDLIDWVSVLRESVTGLPKIREKFDYGWAEEVGNMPLARFSTREKLYDYWEEIHGKYSTVIKATNDFIHIINEIENYYDEEFEEEFEGLRELVEDFDDWFDRGEVLPNYVLNLKPFKLITPDSYNTAVSILQEFSNLQGVIEQVEEIAEDEKEKHFEGERIIRITSTDPLDQNKIVDAMNRVSREYVKGTTEIEVDPIYWYNNNDEYENIKINETEMKKIVGWINGWKKDIGEWEGGLKFLWFAEELEEFIPKFDKWFDNFQENIQNIERETGNLYLPASQFIEDYINIENISDFDEIINKHRKTEKTVKIENFDKIAEKTAKFLDYIAKIAEKKATQFTSYQKRIEGRGRKTDDTPKGKTTGFFARTEEPQQKGTERNLPQQINTEWNDLLDAINEYYLLPLQGKRFVQAQQLPSWATGHSSLILSIRNAKKNPIGSMLDLHLGKGGIQAFTVNRIETLIEYIEKVQKKKGAFSNDIFDLGEDAVEALNEIFGEQWDDMNKEKIGYTIYDMIKQEDLEDTVKPTEFWKDIEEYYNEHEEENRPDHNYPIEVLRYAINTPELKAWIGKSKETKRGKKRMPEPTYLNPKVIDAIDRLDEVYDKFHKMDVINASLLYAHDTIRKMKNKPIIYSRLSLDHIEDMDIIINKIEKEQKVNLMATEINKIVKAVSSYESIAKNFGINEEAVYTVKAMFR